VFVTVPLLILMVQGLSFNDLSFDELGALRLFPYLGIGAWSVMWTHYTAGVIRRQWTELKPSKLYSKVSHALVTVLILAHPALLAFAQYELTGLTPPASYEAYVGAGAMLAVTAGLIALFVFLSYDVYRKLQKHEFWQRQQWLVAINQSLAMLLIFWHGLTLGQNLSSGWFRYWWLLLGLTFLVGQYSDISSAWRKRFGQNDARL